MLAPTTPAQLAGGFAAAADPGGTNPRANASVANTASNERLIAVLPSGEVTKRGPASRQRAAALRAERATSSERASPPDDLWLSPRPVTLRSSRERCRRWC